MYHRKISIDKDLPGNRLRYLQTRTEGDRPSDSSFFHELEPAIVTHIILDNQDDLIPDLIKGSAKKDWSYVGRIQCRPIYSHTKTPQDNLPLAIPFERNVREYPLKNELVVVFKILGQYYYFRKSNIFNQMNNNADNRWESSIYGQRKESEAKLSNDRDMISAGATNQAPQGKQDQGFGDYFEENSKVHPLIPYEGDLLIESRFGSSIRFGGYNIGNKNGFKEEHPYIWIRNRENDSDLNGTDQGMPIDEDVNEDGTAIQILSGDIESKYKKTVRVDIQRSLGPGTYPTTLDGDQVIVNTDRIVLSTKQNEIFAFGKKSISLGTDGKMTIDAQDDIEIETDRNLEIKDVEMRVESRIIYLGEPDNKDEPLVLGTQLVNWLTELLNVLMSETHPSMTGPTGPPIQAPQYARLQARVRRILSRRNFGV